MNRKLLILATLLMIFVLACSCGKPAVVLFQDDFDDPDSGWDILNLRAGSLGYKDGSYFVKVRPGWGVWGSSNQSYSDFVVDLDATLVEAPDDNLVRFEYGVACREQGVEGRDGLPGDGDGYWFVVDPSGKYCIQKKEGVMKDVVGPTESDVIRQGKATNHLRVICHGSTLEFFVNGEHLATVEDSTFAKGDIALFAAAGRSGNAEVRFDNLVVSEP